MGIGDKLKEVKLGLRSTSPGLGQDSHICICNRPVMILMCGKSVNHLSDTEGRFHCDVLGPRGSGRGKAVFRSVRENHRTKMVPLVLKPTELRL